MSRGSAAVLFPDGEVRYGIYNGTVDLMWRHLFDTTTEAWDAWDVYYRGDGTEPPVPEGEEVFDVVIYSDYGVHSWPGRASRHWIEQGVYPYGDELSDGTILEPEPERMDGKPEWVVWRAGLTEGEQTE